MLIKIGSGGLTLTTLTRVLQPDGFAEDEENSLAEEMQNRARRRAMNKAGASQGEIIDVEGVKGMPIKVSRCCHPIPGDPIIGFITTGSGLSIHKADCSNLLSTDAARWIDVAWPQELQQTYRVGLIIRAENKKSLLAAISSTISSDDADIVELTAKTTADNVAELETVLEVRDLSHLELLQQHLRQMPEVLELRRR